MGFSAVEFSEQVLRIEPLPWQRWLLIHALERLPDARFRFRTVLVLVARQNGKTTIVEVKNLWKMFVLRVPLVVGTAQNLDISEESWEKAVEIVEGIPDLAAEVTHVDRTNGKKALRLSNGSRWKIAAASRKGGRGLSGDDVNLDELREHQTWDSWSAVTKTTMARRKAQIWAFSNAGDARSVVLNDLQEKARAAIGDPGSSLGLFEWSAPDDCPIDDPRFWAMANPSLGYTVTEEALRSALETDPEPVFRTECLCQRVPDLFVDVIPTTVWAALADVRSEIVGPVAFALDMPWDRSSVVVTAGGRRADGRRHCEVMEQRPGAGWVVPYLRERAVTWRPCVVLLDGNGPAASLSTELEPALAEVGVKLVTVGGPEMSSACGSFYDAAMGDDLRHLDDVRINDALAGAKKSDRGDVWRWDRKDSRSDIAPLVASTMAVHGAVAYGAEWSSGPSLWLGDDDDDDVSEEAG